MDDKMYFLIKVVAELDIYQPYWGLLTNRSTKSYFEANQYMFLNGRWIFVCVKNKDYDVMQVFLRGGFRPDNTFTNDSGRNTWFAWQIKDIKIE